ncbi:hypothetical protein PRZ48_005929 [Zasmidium cellare]|uniref:Ankyrin repeat protein n=1 Tax=Zasmidium cellare TaxID=395010 RepID=A0ABR0ELN0_ZASCE|nr:hypothetical protein PRZ48_005929 [Zasmidium cellare]
MQSIKYWLTLWFSIRSLRMKLKEWNHRRCDLDHTESQQGACVSQKPLLEQDDGYAKLTPSHSTHPVQLPLQSGLHLTAKTFVGGTTASAHLSGLSPISSRERPSEGGFRRIYEDLERAHVEGHFYHFAELLRSCSFLDGQTSILHHAISAPDTASPGQLVVVGGILKFLQSEGLDASHRDSRQRTSTELAVRAHNLPLLELLFAYGAPTNFKNSDGHSPLYVALLIHAPLDIYDCLLRNGADANVEAGSTEASPLAFVMNGLRECCTTGDKASTVWFAIARKLVEHGAKYSLQDVLSLLMNFCQVWITTGGTQELLDDINPLLSAWLANGLDPSDDLLVFQSRSCACSSLAQLAFFHTQSTAFGALLIRSSQLNRHGKSILRRLFSGCRDTSASRPDLNSMLRSLLAQTFDMAGLNPLECVLQCPDSWHSWESKASFIHTLLELIPQQCILTSSWPEEHGKIIEEAAKCPNPNIRYRIGEDLLTARINPKTGGEQPALNPLGAKTVEQQTNSPTGISIHFDHVLSQLHDLITRGRRSESAWEAIQKGLNYHGVHHKEVVGCFVHLVTKTIIQAPGGLSKVLLYRLLSLRRDLQLPDVHVPNKLLIDMLEDAARAHGVRDAVRKQQHNVYGGYYPASDIISPFWNPSEKRSGTKRQRPRRS